MSDESLVLRRWWRRFFLDLLPIITVLFLILLIALPIQGIGAVRIGSLWPLMGITYWTLVRPRAMGPFTVFLFGILVDLISFCPLGLHAFVFVLAQAVLRRQRRFLVGQGFWVLWAAFTLLAFVAAFVLMGLAAILQHHVVNSLSIVGAAALASALLPLLLWVLDRVHDVMDLFDEPI